MHVFGVFPSRLDQNVATCISNRSKMHSKSFFFLQSSRFFTFLFQKLWSEKQLSQNTSKLLPVKMHIFMHKFILILLALGQKKMSLKNDQLEVGGSV